MWEGRKQHDTHVPHNSATKSLVESKRQQWDRDMDLRTYDTSSKVGFGLALRLVTCVGAAAPMSSPPHSASTLSLNPAVLTLWGVLQRLAALACRRLR